MMQFLSLNIPFESTVNHNNQTEEKRNRLFFWNSPQVVSEGGERCGDLVGWGVAPHSSSLSRVASVGELAKRMGQLSLEGKADLMSRPWPVSAA